MDTSRKLAEGIAGWLLYEFQCNRSGVFNERYLSTAVSNILLSVYGANVHSEFLHPILAPAKTGPGRRPEVDFAVVKTWPTPLCVIETKWVGPTLLSASDIIWDLLRLELIAHATKADAFFVLAGRTKYLRKLFTSKAFLGAPTRNGKHRPLLKLDARKTARLRVDNPQRDRVAVYKDLFVQYQDVLFPSRITMEEAQQYPENPKQYQYQVFSWRILSKSAEPRFKPSSHKEYRA